MIIKMKCHRFVVFGLVSLIIVFLGIYLLAKSQREKQERAKYRGHTVCEWVRAALQDESYWSSQWTTGNPPEYADSEAEQEVIKLGSAAVPELERRLRGLRTSKFHNHLISWRIKLHISEKHSPSYFKIPRDVSEDAALINYLLSQMGEAARPAIPAMLASADDLHAWAYYDLLDDFVRMRTAGQQRFARVEAMGKKWKCRGGASGDFN